jgi:hypothetical protein
MDLDLTPMKPLLAVVALSALDPEDPAGSIHLAADGSQVVFATRYPGALVQWSFPDTTEANASAAWTVQ